jgi:nucleotide-binding universal stress UspA family protein
MPIGAPPGDSIYRHILVPTDGSAISERAAKTAARLARGFGARITAVHVMEPFSERAARAIQAFAPGKMTHGEYRRVAEKRGNAALKKVAAQAKAAEVPCEQVLVTGNEPWEGIVDAARDSACDLIVMASHSRVGLERLLLGSVATEVLTHSKTPVLVCR